MKPACPLKLFGALACSLILSHQSAAEVPETIERAALRRVSFPAALKVEDIRKVFGARGDGVTDDTTALQSAINRSRAFVYLPNGIYLVSDRLIYDRGAGIGPTIVGESRDGVVIKLAPDAKGFDDPDNPQAVLRTVRDGKVSADFFKTRVRNLTIDCGEHRGAIGLQFYANNNGQCRNVRIIGNGVAGLDLSHMLNGPLLVSHLVVEGFDAGITAGSGAYNSQTLEHIYVTGQRRYGIQNEGECLSIRGLVSDNTCPALLAGGNTVLIDSELRGGSPEYPAIVSGGGPFARNVTVSSSYGLGLQGYEYHWKRGLGEETDVTLPAKSIEEWSPVQGASLWREPGEVHTLNLPIEETPRDPLPVDFDQWVCVDDFGGSGTDKEDDSTAIHAALDYARKNGKTVLAFSTGTYYGTGTFELTGALRHVVGAGALLRPNKGTRFGFRLIEGDTPLVTFDLIDRALVPSISIDLENASSRTLVVHCLRGELTATGPGKTFLEDSCQRVVIRNPKARVWARQLNSERGTPYANENHGGELWVLGLKSEKTPCLIGTFAGGRTEVLGTWAYVISKTAPENPMWLVEDSEASFAGIIQWHHGRKFYDVLVREIHDGTTTDYTIKKNGGRAALPLYQSR